MLEIIGYLGALLMGISLGLVGGGGSIIALPILVYFFNVPPQLAVSYSLFIVGCTSFFASVSHIKQHHFSSSVAIKYGLSSVFAVAITRYIIMPIIPNTLFTFAGFTFNKSTALLVLFSVLMLVASFKMITVKNEVYKNNKAISNVHLIGSGFFVGVLTGLIGAGGGFLIVPSLINKAGLTIKKAIGTSLIIIGCNSLIGFAISISNPKIINWQLLLFFLTIAFVGTIVGAQISKNLSNQKLKPIFGWFVFFTALYIIFKETAFKF